MNNNNDNNNNLFNVKYNTNSYSNNCNIANKFRQNPKQHVYCFDCKIALKPFTFNNDAILPRVDYEAAVKLDITYIGEMP